MYLKYLTVFLISSSYCLYANASFNINWVKTRFPFQRRKNNVELYSVINLSQCRLKLGLQIKVERSVQRLPGNWRVFSSVSISAQSRLCVSKFAETVLLCPLY